MKHTIGLDIGTNSIGWVLIEGNRIIDKGINIFPIGTNLIKGIQEETKNQKRGEYRRAKRNLFRYKLRRSKLKQYLKNLGFLPNFDKLMKVEGDYQSSQLYKLRSEALHTKIEPKEDIGRIFLLLNKHRGFKSNSKVLTENSNNDEGAVKEGINQLQAFMEQSNALTIGEYFYKMHEKSRVLYEKGQWHNLDEPYDERARNTEGNFILFNNRGIRREEGRYVARWMYENEFDLIWKEQCKHYPELTGSREEFDRICKLPVEQKRAQLAQFKKTAYWQIKFATIYYQRPLKSQKKFIGKCQFEKNKRTAPVSSLLYQEFRIWKQLADVRYSDLENEIYSQPLPYEWRKQLVDYLQIHPKLNLVGGKKKDGSKNTDVLDVLNITNKKNFEFNFDNPEQDKTFEGNKTLFAIYSACGEELYYNLKKENRLEKLWHILYMAKDDEWLKDTLTFTWKFNEEITNRLVEMGLEEGFGAYSSKVLKKILPYMKNGKDEFDALVLANYMKAPDEAKDEISLKSKITQLKNNELRNPVVEKAIGQTIKLVNAILINGNYKIDQKNLSIHIESTREFKKPKTEREKIRRGNTETDKKREEYARFLNEKRKEGKLSFSREIYKNDSIIQKFELWLELGGDKNDPLFKDFEKLTERKDREKHILWLECNRICPYTGRIINLAKLFSPEIEIEHIIPYSCSLDDSFSNKTITFSEINKEKANRTALEYMKSKGEQAVKEFKSRIKVFSKDKQEKKFLVEKPPFDFTNNQYPNASYIAKYLRKKLLEICPDVLLTNGSATAELRRNDWRLSDVLDKIRYEEETGIDIDEYLVEFNLYRKRFEAWRRQKHNSTDITPIIWKELTPELTAEYEAETKNPLYEWWEKVQQFEAFRSAKGKKDRSDHRHHLLDAIITACCSRSIIQQLSTLNQAREKLGYSMYDKKGNPTRERIDCPLSYDEIKAALRDNLVYHSANQRLISSKINKTRKRKTAKESEQYNKQRVYAVRGPLHKDTYYGKVSVFEREEGGFKSIYVSRNGNPVYKFTKEDELEAIYDQDIKEILKRRLRKFKEEGIAINKAAYEKFPLYKYSLKEYPEGEPENPVSKKGNPLPVIKKIRTVYNFPRKMIQLPAKEDKTIVNENRYAESEGNYLMAFYERKEYDKKGKQKKPTRDFLLVKFNEAVDKRRKNEKLFPDEMPQKDGTSIPLMKSCPFLQQGDMVIMYEKNEEEIDWSNVSDLKKRLYKVTQLSSNIVSKVYEYGYISFAKHTISTADAKYASEKFSLQKEYKFLMNSHKQINAIKVKVDQLGKISKMEE